jgi:S-formylglutathione hydrolase FrmB
VALRFVTASDAFERRMNEAFHHRLGELSIDHRFLIVPGSHRYDVVVQALPETIEWLDSQIWRGSPR